jgi:hypothetical protein
VAAEPFRPVCRVLSGRGWHPCPARPLTGCQAAGSFSLLGSSSLPRASAMRLFDVVGLAVDAVGIDLEQDGDRVPGAAGDFGGGDPGVEPEGHGGVAEVVGAAGEGGCVLGGGERGGAGGLPDGAVGAVLDESAAAGAEYPPVGGRAVGAEVPLEHGDEDGRDWD